MHARALSCLLLTGILGLTACDSLTNASNVPSGRYGQSSYEPGESIVVGSLAIEDMRNDFHDGDEVIFLFHAYDPASNRLIPGGESFLLARESCLPRGAPQCDLAQPFHQIVTVPPGYYVLTTSYVHTPDSRSWEEFYLPSSVGFWSRELQSDASLEGTQTVEIEVLADETVYFGELMLSRPGGAKRTFALEGTVGRNDAAAAAAVEAAGFNPATMVYRPAT